MPDGQAVAGSSQRSARRSASSTALPLVRRHRRVAGGGELAGGHLPGQVPVDRPAARRGEQVLQLRHELLHLRGIVGVWWLPTRKRETERNIRHDVYGTRAAPQVAAARRCAEGEVVRVAVGMRPGGGSVRSARMRRRGVTVLLGALLTALLSFGVLSAPIPYVVLGPGPTVNTLGTPTARRSSRSPAGRPRPPPVSSGSPRSGVQPDGAAAVGDRRLVLRRRGGGAARAGLPAGGDHASRSSSATRRTSGNSQTSAETAALRELGYPVQVLVKTVAADGPSAGVLRPGDVITSVDGSR